MLLALALTASLIASLTSSLADAPVTITLVRWPYT